MAAQDPQLLLQQLLKLFADHYEVASHLENDTDDRLSEIEEALQDAFFSYDNALFAHYGVELPFDIYDDDDEEDAEIVYESAQYDDDDADDDFEVDDDEFEVYELDENES